MSIVDWFKLVPFFNTGQTFAVFHYVGTIPVSYDLLKISRSIVVISSTSSLRIIGEMLSCWCQQCHVMTSLTSHRCKRHINPPKMETVYPQTL